MRRYAWAGLTKARHRRSHTGHVLGGQAERRHECVLASCAEGVGERAGGMFPVYLANFPWLLPLGGVGVGAAGDLAGELAQLTRVHSQGRDSTTLLRRPP